MLDAAPIYAEVWTIDKSQKREWDSFLAENGITEQYLQSVLAAHRAALIQFGSVRPQEAVFSQKEKTGVPTLLWSNGKVEVYMPAEPRVMNHLSVVLNRSVKALSEVTEDESIELRAVVRKIQFFLRTHFQTPSFIAEWNQPQPGNLPGRFTIEVIPTRPESAQIFDLWDKVECINYTCYRGQFPRFLPVPTPDEIAKGSSWWQRALQEETPSFSTQPFGEALEPRAILKARKAESIKVLRDSIFQILQQRFDIQRKETKAAIEFPDVLVEEKQSCTFCNKAILDAEKVFETDLSYVFHNYKPSVSGAHFLIFPKRHVRSSEDLREDELKDLHSLSCMLIKALEEKEKRSDILLYTQDDPAVAQKVPHTHTHVLPIPSALKYLVFSMNYDREPTLTREEMQELVKETRLRLSEMQKLAKVS